MLRAISDGWALRGVRNGDGEAFAPIVQRYTPAVYAVAYAHVANRTDAEDIVQETFAKALKAIDSVRDAGAVRPWLTAIARNTARSWLARRARERDALGDLARSDDAAPSHAASIDQHELVQKNLEKIDAAHREVLLMHYFAGMSIREIAHAQECTTVAVKKRLQRAREALGKQVLRGMALPGEEADRDELRRRVLVGLGIGGVVLSRSAWSSAAAVAAVVVLGAIGWWWTQTALTAPGPNPTPIPVVSRVDPDESERAIPVDRPSLSQNEADTDGAADETPAAPAVAVVEPDVLTGTVVDLAGRPVAEATVQYWYALGSGLKSETTGADGSFPIEPEFAEGRAVFFQARSEFLSGPTVGPYDLNGPNAVNAVVVTLGPSARISGTAVNGSGEPLAGRIRARPKEPNLLPGAGGTLDEDGHFELDGLYDGAFRLDYEDAESNRVAIPEYMSLTLRAGQHIRDLLIVVDIAAGEGPISGYVRGDLDEPLAGVAVDLAGTNFESVTDETGWFEFDGLASRPYWVRVETEGYGVWTASKRPGDPVFMVRLQRTQALHGRMTDLETGKPIAEVAYQVMHGEWASWPYVKLRDFTGKDGRFSEASADPQRDTLYVLASGYRPIIVPLSSLPEQEWTEGLRLELEPIEPIRGIVVNTYGDPVPDARVFAGVDFSQARSDLADSWDGGGSFPRTDAEGRFALPVYPEGVTTVTAYHRDYAVGTAAIEPDGRETTVRLGEGGRLHGTAYVDGVPSQGVSVTIYPAGKEASTAVDGRYELRGIAPGLHELGANLHGIHTDDPNLQFGHSFRQDVEIREGHNADVNVGFRSGSVPFAIRLTFNGVTLEEVGYTLSIVKLAYPLGDGEEYFYVHLDSEGLAHWPMVHPGPATLQVIAWKGSDESGHKPGIPVNVVSGATVEVDVAAWWK